MKVIVFDVTDEQYARLAKLATEHHEQMNSFLAARDLPQESTPPTVVEFARARLLVAVEMDEEIRAMGAGWWPTQESA